MKNMLRTIAACRGSGAMVRRLLLGLFLGANSACALDGSAPLMLLDKPIFPIGVTGAPLDLLAGGAAGKPNFERMFAELSGAGMNVYYPLFLTSEVNNTSSTAIEDFIPDSCEARRADPAGGLAALKRHGLAVIFPVFIVVEKTGDLMQHKSLDEKWASARLDAVARCYAGIPILGYQSYDDAPVYQGEGVPIEKLRQLKRLIASKRQGATPYVFLVHATQESLGYVDHAELKSLLQTKLRDNVPAYSTGDLADNIGVYTYPVPFFAPATVGPSVRQFRSMQPNGLAPLVVLQGFGMKDVQLHPSARRPNAVETRFMAFHAVINGAGGILWWGANSVPSNSEIWAAIKKTSGELKRVSPWLTGADAPFQVSGTGAETRLKMPVPGGKHLLLAANPSTTARDVSYSVPGPTVFKTVKRLFTGQSVAVVNGKFADNLPGLGVEVYEVTF